MTARALRSAAQVALVVALLLFATACEKVNVVSSSVSPCFRVLPVAHQAVGGQGTYVDVARVRPGALPRIPLRRRSGFTGVATTAPDHTTSTTARHPDLCMVAYKGTFDPRRIPLLVGEARAGKYAVVIIGDRSQQVRGVVLLDRLPRPLHAH